MQKKVEGRGYKVRVGRVSGNTQFIFKPNGKKIVCKVKVFQMKVKGHGRGHVIKIYGIIRKVLS